MLARREALSLPPTEQIRLYEQLLVALALLNVAYVVYRLLAEALPGHHDAACLLVAVLCADRDGTLGRTLSRT